MFVFSKANFTAIPNFNQALPLKIIFRATRAVLWRFLPENGTSARHIFTTFRHGNLRVYAS
jgi:hypothetical protein